MVYGRKIFCGFFLTAILITSAGCNQHSEENSPPAASKNTDGEKTTPVDEDDDASKISEILPPPLLPDPTFLPATPVLPPFIPWIGGGGGGGGRRGNADHCLEDPFKTTPGICGCGVPDVDTDGDNVLDCLDQCPNNVEKSLPGVCGCNVADLNSDGDTILDCLDTCPTVTDEQQTDNDGDGLGALCECDDGNPEVGAIVGQPRYVAPLGNDTENNCTNVALPCANIIHAIAVSDAGDTVVLSAGTFLEDSILVDKNLVIIGKGPLNTIVDADQNGRVFLVAEDVEATMCGFTITGGLINGEGTDVNLAPGSGGGIFNDGTLLISNVSVSENSANLAAGGIWNNTDSVMDIRNSFITLNSADQSVGGFGNYYLSTMTIDNTLISENSSGNVGGAGGSAGDFFSIKNSLVAANTAPFLAGGLIVIQGLISVGTVEIENTEFRDNEAALGGALVTNGIGVGIKGSRFIDNDAAQDGGAIAVVGQGVVQVNDSTFSGNTAVGNGGAITVMEDSRLFLLMSTLNDNNANIGGGINILQASEAFITNSTVSDNTASTWGGGIYVAGISSLTINLSTIAFNEASTGAGVYKNSDSFLQTFHTIISDNLTEDCFTDIGDAINEANYSLFSDATCTFTLGANNTPNTDPLLGPLQNNGGTTQTHALQATSPAIDAGDTNCFVVFDQRGEARPVNIVGQDPIDAQARCDKGSFEVQLP
jgi:hypothetical protein